MDQNTQTQTGAATTPVTDISVGGLTDGTPTAQTQSAGATTATTATAAAGTPVPATQTAAQSGAASTATAGDDSLFNKFEIPDAVKTQYPDLVPLILQTESMNDDERQYWFQILPIMTDDQVVKLREILTNEKTQLAEIDKQYHKEVKQINEKHVAEWKDFEKRDKREKLKEAEVKTEEQEKAEQDQLLNQLNNI